MSVRNDAQAVMVLTPALATQKAPGDRFTGDAWVDNITDNPAPGCAHLATVQFAPGARTAWHRHAHGQTLHVTSGRGLVATRGEQAITMRQGDTVYTPPGVWHWHGAMPDSFMTHLALSDSGDDPAADVEWGDLIDDLEFDTARTHTIGGSRS